MEAIARSALWSGQRHRLKSSPLRATRLYAQCSLGPNVRLREVDGIQNATPRYLPLSAAATFLISRTECRTPQSAAGKMSYA